MFYFMMINQTLSIINLSFYIHTKTWFMGEKFATFKSECVLLYKKYTKKLVLSSRFYLANVTRILVS